MSHKVESAPSQPSDIGVALGVLGMFFVFLFAFLATTPSPLSTTTGRSGQDSPQVAIASTEQPSSTPVPPTATFTPQPSPTLVSPTATVASQPTAAQSVAAEQPASSNTASSYDAALVAQGQQLFTTCSACHGLDAHGLPNLGKDLIASEFVHSLSDEELLAFVSTGRPIWDSLNTTGVDMPARGGNPTLTDDDLLAIIAYIRTLTAESGSGG
jgi:disulfide bond formation protein DsbB